MVKRWFLVGVILLLVPLLVVSCGVPKEDYEAVVAERDSAQAEFQSLQTELNTAKSELQSVQRRLVSVKPELQSAQSDLSQIASLVPSLAQKLDLIEQTLALECARYRATRAEKQGKTEEKKRQDLLALAALKSFDPLVEDIGDLELSKQWGASWPDRSREASEKEEHPLYSFKDYAECLDRLSALIEADMSDLRTSLVLLEGNMGELQTLLEGVAPAPTPIPAPPGFKTYSKHGFSFEYPDGFRVTEMGVLENKATDKSGLVQVGIENEEVQIFQTTWIQMIQSTWEVSGDLRRMLDDSFAGMETTEGIASVDRGELVETTKAGHQMLYQYYTMTSTEGDKVYGIVAAFYCDESQLVYQLMTINDTISAKQDILSDFQNYLDSFVCH